MGVLSSVRAVRWARKRQPDQVSYWIGVAHERFPPDDLLRQAVEAEQAGFDGGDPHAAIRVYGEWVLPELR
jgi:coenzyme F420-dependent glucose-6-phosphate dehydrogenase